MWIADPQAQPGFVEMTAREWVASRSVKPVATPVDFDGHHPCDRAPAPLLGEHTVEVLDQLGRSDTR